MFMDHRFGPQKATSVMGFETPWIRRRTAEHVQRRGQGPCVWEFGKLSGHLLGFGEYYANLQDAQSMDGAKGQRLQYKLCWYEIPSSTSTDLYFLRLLRRIVKQLLYFPGPIYPFLAIRRGMSTCRLCVKFASANQRPRPLACALARVAGPVFTLSLHRSSAPHAFLDADPG